MSNPKNEKNGQEVEQQQVQNTPEQQPAPVEQQQVTTTEPEKKEGFGGWLKRHWKGTVAGVAAVFAVGGSAYAAYRKGKAVGINSVPVNTGEQEDYSLNPNE